MAFTSPRMSLRVWNSATDPYDHEQLAYNWLKLDQHDHAEGRGTPIPGAGIQDGAITSDKIYPGSITGSALADGSVSGNKLADGGVVQGKIGHNAVTNDSIAPDSVSGTQIQSATIRDSNLANGAKVPVGTVIQWYRPSSATPIPLGYVECKGQSVTDHSFVGVTTVVVPDMRNRFVLGADSAATGTSTPSAAPGVGALGNSHTIDLTHSHSVSVANHIHKVNPHFHSFSADVDIFYAASGSSGAYYSLKLGSGAATPYHFGGFTSTGRGYTSGSAVPPTGTPTTAEPDTNAAGGFTTNTTNAFGVTDKRPAYVGLIYLMKVKEA